MNRLVVALWLCVSAFAVCAAESRPFTVEDLVRLERVSDPQLSPDQRYVAYTLRRTDMAQNKGINAVWLLDLKRGEHKALTPASASAQSPRWSADGRFIYFLSADSGSSQVWRQSIDGGAASQVTDLALPVGVFLLSPDGKQLAVTLEVFADCSNIQCSAQKTGAAPGTQGSGVLYERLFVRHWDTWSNGSRSQLFSLKIDNEGRAQGEPIPISQGLDGDVPSKPFGGAEEITYSPDGRQLYFTARIAGKTEAWSTNLDIWQAPSDGSAKPRNLTADNPATDTAPRISPDGRTMVYLAMKRAGFEADRLALTEKSLQDGKTREIAPGWDRSATSLSLTPDGRHAIVSADHLGQTPLFAIRLRDGKVRQVTGAGHVSGYSVGAERLIYAEDALDRPADLYATIIDGGASKRLTSHNASRLADVEMGAFEQFRFPGWNSESVYGYVMKPAGYTSGRKYPVVLIIHGGPQGSMGNNFHYRWNPEVIAGMGYAVLFIDFHGSTGYGQAFTDSISRDWGGKPLEDLQQGWNHALQQYPFLDGTRACAMGGSYGGYMINWIQGAWRDTFDCLINHDGVFDTRSMAYSTEELWFDEWEMGGTPFDAPAGHERFNPASQVAQWSTPMLVIHGALDYRIPLEQGLAAFTALQRRGIESQFLYFPDENHWVLKPRNSVQWHDTVQSWLQRWIGDGARQAQQESQP